MNDDTAAIDKRDYVMVKRERDIQRDCKGYAFEENIEMPMP